MIYVVNWVYQIPIFPGNRKTPETNVSGVNLTFEHNAPCGTIYINLDIIQLQII